MPVCWCYSPLCRCRRSYSEEASTFILSVRRDSTCRPSRCTSGRGRRWTPTRSTCSNSPTFAAGACSAKTPVRRRLHTSTIRRPAMWSETVGLRTGPVWDESNRSWSWSCTLWSWSWSCTLWNWSWSCRSVVLWKMILSRSSSLWPWRTQQLFNYYFL